MGAWPVVSDFIEETTAAIGCQKPNLRYAGRPSAASPATGLAKRHKLEQAQLIDDALTIGLAHVGRIATRTAEPQ
jgi:2-oxoglutarate dehydrogenase E1 component